jgi:hypothetical protein
MKCSMSGARSRSCRAGSCMQFSFHVDGVEAPLDHPHYLVASMLQGRDVWVFELMTMQMSSFRYSTFSATLQQVPEVGQFCRLATPPASRQPGNARLGKNLERSLFFLTW